jgi:hypothetical protein
MGLFARDAVVFVCGTMTAYGLDAFTQLVKQAPRWMDVFLVGYTYEPREAPPVVIGRRTFEHRLYDVDDLTGLGFPVKSKGFPTRKGEPDAEFKLMPGNIDLIHFRFAHEHPGYRRYWSVEDDVRFGGDWADLFGHFKRSPAALLGTSMRRRTQDSEWVWWEHLRPPAGVALPDNTQQVASFLPFVAYTPSALGAIGAGYHAGWTGHYESLWPTLALDAGLEIRDLGGAGDFVAPGDENRFYTNTGMGKLAPGTFVWRPTHADYEPDSGKLWHPVRDVVKTP